MPEVLETIHSESGLMVRDLVIGEGKLASGRGQTVTVHYTGWLEDGTEFDSSVSRNEPFKFPLQVGYVIPGWDEGIIGMKVGGKRKLTIPGHLAYGEVGAGKMIPENATLIFEIELLHISE
jgi:FKBP-type peptidyl-prolyl cis-trans isomerase